MKIVQYEKSGKWKNVELVRHGKKCNTTELQYERMQHEKRAAWK